MNPVPDRSPFTEDSDAHKLARALGFTLARRYLAIDIFDEHALKDAGFMVTKPKPDFARISAALHNGEDVPGAKWRGAEYVLRPCSEVDDCRVLPSSGVGGRAAVEGWRLDGAV